MKISPTPEEAASWLHSRGIEVDGSEDPEFVGELQHAVERFDRRVAAMALQADLPGSPRPEERRLVLPRRVPREPLRAYVSRIEAATAELEASRASARRGASEGKNAGRGTSHTR